MDDKQIIDKKLIGNHREDNGKKCEASVTGGGMKEAYAATFEKQLRKAA